MDSKDIVPKDLYRDTPVRYLGYANEVGEAFRAIIGSKLVLASYGVAVLYVCADTTDKTIKTHQEKSNAPNRIIQTSFTAADTLIWQMLASVAIPGYTINRICAGSMWFMKKNKAMSKINKAPRNMIVAGIGLAVIPLIIHPIDHFVDVLMDKTLRHYRPQ
ncbi:mitochondrial fission process protein 1-like [Atheta coriaria]|uniref:mitochondrial fission process protein 1-like n=1 Tax=Dalotia coriaria TaxID=877792 RepID=UPI0031F44779